LVFAKVSVPKVTGAKVVGARLKATVKAWSPNPKLSYQWYRAGKKIAKATKASYTLKPADKGQRISVKVTGVKAGYAQVVKASTKTKPIQKSLPSGARPGGLVLSPAPGTGAPHCPVRLDSAVIRGV
jgi:hypothetical protein